MEKYLIDTVDKEQLLIDFNVFIKKWDQKYIESVSEIDIFDFTKTSKFTTNQKEYLVRALYHIRGHFHKFLWCLGNYAPHKEAKEAILDNIKEEFGGNGLSHEQHYFKFCKSIGFEIADEFVTENTYDSFIREFNRCHLQWLNNHNWESNWSVFSAYERLDNIDYSNLLVLAKSIGAKDAGLIFFVIHNKADHFDKTCEDLQKIWLKDKDLVIEGFTFIAQTQIKMWQLFSDAVCSR